MKTTLLKNTLLAVSLIISTASFSQIDYTFDTDDEGFTVAGPGTSGSHDPVTGILTATTGGTGSNLQLRKNANDIGNPTTLTTVLLDLKNNSNADNLVLQTVSGGVTVITNIAITAGDTAEQSYRIDVPNPSATWIGSFQLRLRFTFLSGNLNGGTIEVNRIQIVDPASLSITKNRLEGVNIYPNPATSFLNVKTLEGGNISIYNILGAKIKSEKAISKSYRMNISSLESGLYVLKIESDNKLFTQKIIVE